MPSSADPILIITSLEWFFINFLRLHELVKRISVTDNDYDQMSNIFLFLLLMHQDSANRITSKHHSHHAFVGTGGICYLSTGHWHYSAAHLAMQSLWNMCPQGVMKMIWFSNSFVDLLFLWLKSA